jgi:magnesium-transporting ATPase (P-type)
VDVLEALGATAAGLSTDDALCRLSAVGPNAVRSPHARRLAVLLRQLASPLLLLLAVAATASFFLGERTDAAIIGAILTALPSALATTTSTAPRRRWTLCTHRSVTSASYAVAVEPFVATSSTSCLVASSNFGWVR